MINIHRYRFSLKKQQFIKLLFTYKSRHIRSEFLLMSTENFAFHLFRQVEKAGLGASYTSAVYKVRNSLWKRSPGLLGGNKY